MSFILCLVLMVAMTLTTTACKDKNNESDRNTVTGTTAPNETDAVGDTSSDKTEDKENVLGTGAVVFHFCVVDGEGKESAFEIHTDKTVVGDALLELGLIAGDESEYGLYVKTVNGVTADYDVDQTYWAFYINGEYAMTGVDATPIEAGSTYTFKVEK